MGSQPVGSRAYRICSYSPSAEGENPEWLNLDIQLNGKSFSIRVLLSKFYNSPNRTTEFHEHFDFLASGVDVLGHFDDNHDGTAKAMNGIPSGDDSNDMATNTIVVACDRIDKCFEWAVKPCLPALKAVAPQPSEASCVTLHDYFALETFQIEVGAVNDKLVSGKIRTVNPARRKTSLKLPGQRLSPFFPSYLPYQVDVISDEPRYIFEDEPRRVFADSQEFFFKTLINDEATRGIKEIQKYEQVHKAQLDGHARTSRLFGIVQDSESRLYGLLLHKIDEDITLVEALERGASKATKARWASQIGDSMRALHKAGVVWGDVQPDNVLIDMRGDAWLVDFGGGHANGWVDVDKAGTMEGDRQGLDNILAFIATE